MIETLWKYILLYLLFAAPAAAIGALWHVLRRRRAQRLPYRKQAGRRIAGGLALLAVYTLTLLAMFLRVGYNAVLAAMRFTYEDGAYAVKQLLEDAYSVIDEQLEEYDENIVLMGMDGAVQRAIAMNNWGRCGEEEGPSIAINDVFPFFQQDFSRCAIFKNDGERLISMLDYRGPVPAWEPGFDEAQSLLPLKHGTIGEKTFTLTRFEAWAYNLANKADTLRTGSVRDPIRPFSFQVPLIPKEDRLLHEYAFCVPAVLRLDHAEQGGQIVYTGDEALQFPGEERYYIYVSAAYSPVRAAFSYVYIPKTRALSPSPDPDDDPSWYFEFSFDDWSSFVLLSWLISTVAFLLLQVILFSRHERREAIRQRNLLLDVAHELKTPMGSVMLKGEEVLEGETLEDKNQSAEEMIVQIERMRARLNEVLQNARLESMGVRLRYESFSLREAAEDAMDQVAALAEAKALSVGLQGDDIAVEADRAYIVRAVFNFLTNAVKNTPQGGQILCRLRRERNSALCSVYNSGSSVPQKEMKKIWQQFYKIGDGGDNARKGTGVGLSTVKGIVALHGGACGCRNTDNGVEFWFRIPPRRVLREKRCFRESSML